MPVGMNPWLRPWPVLDQRLWMARAREHSRTPTVLDARPTMYDAHAGSLVPPHSPATAEWSIRPAAGNDAFVPRIVDQDGDDALKDDAVGNPRPVASQWVGRNDGEPRGQEDGELLPNGVEHRYRQGGHGNLRGCCVPVRAGQASGATLGLAVVRGKYRGAP